MHSGPVLARHLLKAALKPSAVCLLVRSADDMTCVANVMRECVMDDDAMERAKDSEGHTAV